MILLMPTKHGTVMLETHPSQYRNDIWVVDAQQCKIHEATGTIRIFKDDGELFLAFEPTECWLVWQPFESFAWLCIGDPREPR